MDILMPQLGETVAEGKITTWYKSVGDRVAAGDALFEIETDKTSMEVPTTEAGVLAEIRVAAGATVPVGSIVAVVSAGAASAPRGAARAFDPANPVRTPQQHYGPATLSGGVKVTPVARRLAAEAGVDLSGLKGSGPHGHIVARDVQSATRSTMGAHGNGEVTKGATPTTTATASATASATGVAGPTAVAAAPPALSARQI